MIGKDDIVFARLDKDAHERDVAVDDLHLLPYDGIGDWEYNVNRLRASKPLEYLNFELTIHSKPNRHENDGYAAMPLPVYLAEAYKRACRIARRYAR